MGFQGNSQTLTQLCVQMDSLNTLIRDQKIDKLVSMPLWSTLIKQVKKQILPTNALETWVFPVQGYDATCIGGKGSGYIHQGYDYFTGNNHKAHPAHDIFIYDVNQDDIEDKSRKLVPVLSVNQGVVVALSQSWDTTSTLRGGIYAWVYYPKEDAVGYYAHLHSITVKVGEVLAAGQKIGYVGRTGLNAHKKRSPTHLHFSWLSVKTDIPIAENPYQKLLKANRIP